MFSFSDRQENEILTSHVSEIRIPIFSSYILSLPTADEQDSYLRDMLDPSNRDHADLVIEFTEKREEFSGKEAPPPPGIAKVYRKKALDGEGGKGGEGRKKKADEESAAATQKREVIFI